MRDTSVGRLACEQLHPWCFYLFTASWSSAYLSHSYGYLWLTRWSHSLWLWILKSWERHPTSISHSFRQWEWWAPYSTKRSRNLNSAYKRSRTLCVSFCCQTTIETQKLFSLRATKSKESTQWKNSSWYNVIELHSIWQFYWRRNHQLYQQERG